MLSKFTPAVPPVVSRVLAPKVTAPLNCCAPVVLMVEPFNTLWPLSVKLALLLRAWFTVMTGAYTVIGPAMSTKLFKVTFVKLPDLPSVKPVRDGS